MAEIIRAFLLLSTFVGALAGVPNSVESGESDANAGLTSSEITYLTALLCVVFALVVLIFMFAAVTYRLRLYWKRALDRNQLLELNQKDNIEISVD